MTARYAPAAFLAALLHAAVIAVLVWFAMTARSVPEAMPRLSGAVFDLVNPSATPTQMSEQGVQVVIRPMPKVKVTAELAPVVENDPPIVQPKSKERVNPKPQLRPIVKPPRNTGTKVKPQPTTQTPTPPVRIDEIWPVGSPSTTPSDIPSADANAPQATSELEAYMAELRERLKAALQAPGMRPNLLAEVEFVLRADGMLLQPRVITSSGSAEFDRAIVQAINRTRMRARPDGKTVKLKFPFATELK